MSLRYGDKARSGEPVGNAGRRQSPSGTFTKVFEQTFIAPGTWTWPGNTTSVTVLVVGGGAGGPAPGSPIPLGQAGGGGGVRVGTVPVTGPMPVTVGAGGSAGVAPVGPPTPLNAYGDSGGTSAFGSTTPTAPYPTSTVIVGGGLSNDPLGLIGQPPPLFRGSASSDVGLSTSIGQDNGLYGSVGSVYSHSSLTPTSPHSPVEEARASGGAGGHRFVNGTFPFGGADRYGYGAGTTKHNYSNEFLQDTVSNIANNGKGARVGQAGSAGIVIVRWTE